ncbi:beta-lactamase-like protein [Phaeosphaeriaceae sp. PMI808]|nr:beta-lactamase-like protein [Phaeosphaeriaceae sp. PMI808]
MSTFKGIIAEFPQIRIDYFKQQPGFKAPLACFLSHVHSDHRIGLESQRAPFLFCSAATREILLRLEKHHHRINFANGILESRNVTYGRSMHRLVKPLPLDTPTTIELAPNNSIRATLIDANHCVGAVMFLIEGNGNAILYTGDIRAETWWVNSLVQNPVLLPYTLGKRRLKCLYLDTTFATKSEPYREFPTKAEGIQELLDKVGQFSDNTLFYFHSWTFGYENVWIALSSFLESQIHLDDYRARIYGSLSVLDKRQLREVGLKVQTDNKFLRDSGLEVREATALCGFRNGNHTHPGCLTSQESVRIHSCEQGMGCQVMDSDTESKVVHIIPIITRANGAEIAEAGAGGGKGDLDQKEQLETGDATEVGKLMELCAKAITDENLLSKVLALLQQTVARGDVKLDLDVQLQKANEDGQENHSVSTVISVLSRCASSTSRRMQEPHNRIIRFPYSRHSSYSELCELVAAFKPEDIFPCTVDEENWTPELSIQSLFGELCCASIFRHDGEMTQLYEAKLQRQQKQKRNQEETQEGTQFTNEQLISSPTTCKRFRESKILPMGTSDQNSFELPLATSDGTINKPSENVGTSILGRSVVAIPLEPLPTTQIMPPATSTVTTTLVLPSYPSISSKTKNKKLTNRRIAYEAAIGTHLTWADYGGLTSTRRKEDYEEEEL